MNTFFSFVQTHSFWSRLMFFFPLYLQFNLQNETKIVNQVTNNLCVFIWIDDEEMVGSGGVQFLPNAFLHLNWIFIGNFQDDTDFCSNIFQ